VLSAFWNPTSKPDAKNGVEQLIALLKREVSKSTIHRLDGHLPIGEWLIRFTSLENNPRAQRLISEGMPYSPDTIALYKVNYDRYIEGDPFLSLDINTVDVSLTRAFIARLGMMKTKDGRDLAGTRVFETTVTFARMAFKENWEDHQDWKNPFERIKPPKRTKVSRCSRGKRFGSTKTEPSETRNGTSAERPRSPKIYGT